MFEEMCGVFLGGWFDEGGVVGVEFVLDVDVIGDENGGVVGECFDDGDVEVFLI